MLIEYIHARRHYQLTGEADDAMKRARINNVWRQDDAYSKWELQNLTVRNILLGRFFISKQAVTAFNGPGSYRANAVALHEAGLLFNPCIKMQNPWLIDVAVRHCMDVDECCHNIERMCRAGATPLQVWMALTAALGRPNEIEALNDFRIYEMMTSLGYCGYGWTEADFFHVGPGAEDVLREEGLLPATLVAAQHFAKLIGNALHFDFPYPFTFRTLEDCACEYRKYLRSLKLGQELPEKYRYYPKSRECTR